MPYFNATQMDLRTGNILKVEHYRAADKTEAVKKMLYTRRLAKKNCKLGVTGLVATCGDGTAWVITKDTSAPREGPKEWRPVRKPRGTSK